MWITNEKKNNRIHCYIRAVSISYETKVTFPNSPFLDNFTVMGAVIVAEYMTLSCFLYLFSLISVHD
jgi:hypothetical protein